MARDYYETPEGERALRERQIGGEQAVGEFAAIVRERLAPIVESLASPRLLSLLQDLEDPHAMIEDAEEDRSQAEWERGVAAGIYPSEEEIAEALANPKRHEGPPF